MSDIIEEIWIFQTLNLNCQTVELNKQIHTKKTGYYSLNASSYLYTLTFFDIEFSCLSLKQKIEILLRGE